MQLSIILGATIMGYEVQVGWGKSVPLPPAPFYASSSEDKASRPIISSG